jgi:two-component sensor histidine kinase
VRLAIEGPALVLRPDAAQIIGMAIHELATNACKHGALSVDNGKVRLSWGGPGWASDGRFRMCWEETGGPAFAAGGTKGFGRTLLTELAAYQLDAEVALDGRSDGLVWRLAAPAHTVLLVSDPDKAPPAPNPTLTIAPRNPLLGTGLA